MERNTVITLLLAGGAAFALYLEQPSGPTARRGIAGSGLASLSLATDGSARAVATASDCSRPLEELFPVGKRFGSEELAGQVRDHCENVRYSANEVMSLIRDGETWYVKAEKSSAFGRADMYEIKWIKNQADYVASFGK